MEYNCQHYNGEPYVIQQGTKCQKPEHQNVSVSSCKKCNKKKGEQTCFIKDCEFNTIGQILGETNQNQDSKTQVQQTTENTQQTQENQQQQDKQKQEEEGKQEQQELFCEHSNVGDIRQIKANCSLDIHNGKDVFVCKKCSKQFKNASHCIVKGCGKKGMDQQVIYKQYFPQFENRKFKASFMSLQTICEGKLNIDNVTEEFKGFQSITVEDMIDDPPEMEKGDTRDIRNVVGNQTFCCNENNEINEEYFEKNIVNVNKTPVYFQSCQYNDYNILLTGGAYAIDREQYPNHPYSIIPSQKVVKLNLKDKLQQLFFEVDYSLPNMNYARVGHEMVSFNGGKQIYVLGGNNESSYHNSVEQINLSEDKPQWQEMEPMSKKRSRFLSVGQNVFDNNNKIVEQNIIVIGGFVDFDSQQTVNLVEKYNTATNKWKQLIVQSEDTVLSGGFAFQHPDTHQIFVFGGINQNKKASDKIYEFIENSDGQTCSFKQIGRLVLPRSNLKAVVSRVFPNLVNKNNLLIAEDNIWEYQISIISGIPGKLNESLEIICFNGKGQISNQLAYPENNTSFIVSLQETGCKPHQFNSPFVVPVSGQNSLYESQYKIQ